MLQSVQNFKNFVIYLYFVSQPDVRPTSGSSMVPEISHNIGNHGGFTKLSFRLKFLHCAIEMSLIFLLNFLSSSIMREHCRKVSITCLTLNMLKHVIDGLTIDSILLTRDWKLPQYTLDYPCLDMVKSHFLPLTRKWNDTLSSYSTRQIVNINYIASY